MALSGLLGIPAGRPGPAWRAADGGSILRAPSGLGASSPRYPSRSAEKVEAWRALGGGQAREQTTWGASRRQRAATPRARGSSGLAMQTRAGATRGGAAAASGPEPRTVCTVQPAHQRAPRMYFGVISD